MLLRRSRGGGSTSISTYLETSFKIFVYLYVLTIASHYCQACVPTNPIGTTTSTTTTTTTTKPANTTTTTTTTAAPGVTTTTSTTTTTTTTTTRPQAGCCAPLTQTLTNTQFPDGLMTFTYNSNTCRTSVSIFCTQTDPAFDLYAAIVANGQYFLNYGPGNSTFPGTCNTTTQQWQFGQPPLIYMTLECLLTNPPSG